VSPTKLVPKRPPLAALLYGLLLAGMAVSQLVSFDAFEDALASYQLPGGLHTAAVIGLPTLEVLAALGLLGARMLPQRAAHAAAVLGLVVAVAWSTLAVQAFARGLEVQNCGCFGAYLAQELRWWVLLEDAYLLLLAVWAAASLGVQLPGTSRGRGQTVAAALAIAALIVPGTGAGAERCCLETGERAYASLEDTTAGKIALVVRADHPALRSRCSRGTAIRTAHVIPAPAGVLLREGRDLSLDGREPIRRVDGSVVGSVEVRVSLRLLPPRASGQ
jgi:Methylamine utilisation protein MauE